MAKLHVTDADGIAHEIEAEPTTESIMSILLAEGLDTGLCGGSCACGTCCAAIEPEWAAKLAEADENETGLTDCAEPPFGCARLTCQIPFSAELDGIKLTMIPIE